MNDLSAELLVPIVGALGTTSPAQVIKQLGDGYVVPVPESVISQYNSVIPSAPPNVTVVELDVGVFTVALIPFVFHK